MRPSSQHAQFLAAACARDDSLRREVESLLAIDQSLPGYLAESELADQAGRRAAEALIAEDGPARHPDRIGRYQIRGILGRGGMGTVYEAQQENPRRGVALKVIRAGVASERMLRRFEHEAQLLGRLQHPGIAQIFEAGTAEIDGPGRGAQPFFAMEFVQGRPITEHANHHGLSTRQRLELFTNVCQAIEHAHQKGVIHRDLKPANVLVSDTGQPKVLDFGVARATDSDIQTTTLRTDVGQLIGTVPFMSPEQVAGDSALLDARSDVYSLGVLSYELLTGRLPYDLSGKSIPEAARIIREDTPTPLSAANRTLRGDLETIISKALEKEKDRRYQSAAELAVDIQRYLSNTPILARPPSAAYQLRKLIGRHKLPFALVAALFVLMTSFGVWMSLLYRNAEQLRVAAEQERTEALDARDREHDARVTAEHAANKVKRVHSFFNQILATGAPSTGRPVTMREALDKAAEKVEEELHAYPLAESTSRMTIGKAYHALGEYDLAEVQLRRALKLRLDVFEGEHKFIAASEYYLACTLRATGEHEEAARLLERALETRRRLLAAEDPHLAQTMGALADSYRQLGKQFEADRLLREAAKTSPSADR
jgi:non-specific serine/threonine protein kinase/serine/threonine-protein kinase